MVSPKRTIMKKFLIGFFLCFIVFLVFLLTKIPPEQWSSVIILIVLMALPIGIFVFNFTKEKKDTYDSNTEYMKQKIKEHIKKGDYN